MSDTHETTKPKARILVVDDDDTIALSMQLKLREEGYDVPATARSAEDALLKVSTLKPDLVLMDVRLEGPMDGVDTAIQIRKQYGTSIVFVTGYADDATLERAKRAEPYGYILKPVADRELLIVTELALHKGSVEKALQDSERKFRAVVETANDAVISADSSDTIIFFNKAAEKLFGYSAGVAIGQPLTILMPERYRQAHLTAFNRFFATGTGTLFGRTLELSGRRRDGEEFPVELSLANWKTSEGTFVTAILRDISERRRAEAAEQRSQELLDIDRQKDEFLAIISHELRTPLTAMLGWIKLLRNGQVQQADQPHALEVVERNILAQTHLIEELLDISRIVAGKLTLNLETLDVRPVVSDAVEAIRPSAEARSIKLSSTTFDRGQAPSESSAFELRIDPSRLQQVVYNLLGNAIKFTPKGGAVSVKVERKNSAIEISVSDTGIGIERDFLPCLFERFKQADSSTSRGYDGLGLGLSIVKHLVELHGGTVVADSPGKGAGATFTVTLNVNPSGAKSSQALSAVDTSAAAPPGLMGVRVLVVEDEPDAREMLTTALDLHGAETRSAGNARDALDVLDSFKPHVLLSDIGLPGGDGFTFIQKVRARNPENGGATPAIALTAYARSEDRDRVLASGFQGHLAKPVEPTALIVAIAKLAGRGVKK